MNKVLTVMDFIQEQHKQVADLLRLAFAATIVDIPTIRTNQVWDGKERSGVLMSKIFPVVQTLTEKLAQMANDIEWYNETRVIHDRAGAEIYQQSFLSEYHRVPCESVDIIVTSPPYMNNYHYNRNTRPQRYWLGFCQNPGDLKSLENLNFGTYWQNARYKDDVALNPTVTDPQILETLEMIRSQNTDKGVYGGVGGANYATIYLNDCVRFIRGVVWTLRPGGTAIVV